MATQTERSDPAQATAAFLFKIVEESICLVEQRDTTDVSMKVELPDGIIVHDAGAGKGACEAIFQALQKMLCRTYPHVMELELGEWALETRGKAFELLVRFHSNGKEWRVVSRDDAKAPETPVQAFSQVFQEAVEWFLLHSKD